MAVWLAPLIGLATTAVSAGVTKSTNKTNAHIAELQVMLEEKRLDSNLQAAKLERDARTSENVAAASAVEAKAVTNSKTTEQVLSYLPYMIGAFVLTLLIPVLFRRKGK